MSLKFFHVLIFQFFGLTLYGQSIDSCGLDNSPILNAYEAEFFNQIFKNKRADFDFRKKKVGFFFEPNGKHLGCKKIYFGEVRGHKRTPVSYLIKLNNAEKQESNGYDIVIVTWSHIYRKKLTRKMLRRLRNNETESYYYKCAN